VGDPACRELIHFAVEHLKRSFNVDENRVYLAGDSDGGRGAYATAETEATLFAAAARSSAHRGRQPLCEPAEPPVVRDQRRQGLDLPRGGGAAAGRGMKASGIDLQWTLIDDAPHDPYLFLKHKDDICGLLRKAPPRSLPAGPCTWSSPRRLPATRGGFPANTMRWVRIETTGESEHDTAFDDAGKGLLRGDLARVRARRDKNRIEIETRGVKTLTVLPLRRDGGPLEGGRGPHETDGPPSAERSQATRARSWKRRDASRTAPSSSTRGSSSTSTRPSPPRTTGPRGSRRCPRLPGGARGRPPGPRG